MITARSDTWQTAFYRNIGKYIMYARRRKNFSESKVARLSGQQFNTIRGIEKGNRFTFHQASWLKEVLDISIDEMLKEVTHQIISEGAYNGEEEIYQEESNQEGGQESSEEVKGIESFI